MRCFFGGAGAPINAVKSVANPAHSESVEDGEVMYAKKGTRNDKRGSKRKDPYRKETVERILQAKEAPFADAPHDPEEFLQWLNGDEAKPK